MEKMNAAVVTSFEEPPHYLQFDAPVAGTDDEFVVDVVAVGLHPRVRSGASGNHYTSSGKLPMIPGIDGVARRPDGKLVYFIADDHVSGTMAQQAVADPRRCVELPDGVDTAQVAAALNPAMSSWVALRRKLPLQPGQRVLVLGATGNAGMMAVRIAKLLGAGLVVGAGRDRARLESLREIGVDGIVQLTDDAETTATELATAAADVDVVIDYLWGGPALMTMKALLDGRTDRSAPLDWIQIGAITGPTIELPSTLLRSANLRIQGNGQGSVSPRAYVAELPSLVEAISDGKLPIRVNEVPLSEVEQAWGAPEAPGERTVLVP